MSLLLENNGGQMAKILSLRLNYKDKFLDYAKEGKEIKKSFTVGSNKFMQWQILDPKFPDKHVLVKKKGGEYVLNILPGAKLSVEMGGNSVDANYLKQNNLLSLNELTLKEDMKGTVSLAPDWEVEFEYRTPWVVVLTPEEKAIVAQYARRARPDAVARFNRTVILLVLALTIVFSIIFELFLKPEYKTQADTISELLQSMEQKAQKVEVSKLDAPTTGYDVPPPVEEVTGDDAAPTTGAVSSGAARPSGPSGLGAAMGGFDPNAVSAAPTISIVTVATGFAVNRPGGGRPGSGSGTGGSGAGGGAGSAGTVFDPTALPVSGDVGSVATQGPRTSGSLTRPEGAVGTHVTGDASKLAPSGKAWGDIVAQQRIEAEYRQMGLSTVTEASIGTLDEAGKAKYASLKDQVESRKGQIETVYREMQIRQSVSFTITIFVGADGSVRESKVVPNGQYPEAFVAKVKQVVDSWRFNVREAMPYQFRMRAG